MALQASSTPHVHLDGFFYREFRDHVGASLDCACDLTGPARNCDVGMALHNAATRGDWEERKRSFLKRGRTGSP